MQAAKIGAVIGALFLASAAQAQSNNTQASPTGGPLKTTTGSNMPAPGLSGRHPNTSTSAMTGSADATASATEKKKSSHHAMSGNAATSGKMPAP